MERWFVMELAEELILQLMEDPAPERDRNNREHIYAMKARCEKTRAISNLPLRPYGFWTFDRFNARLRWDAHISQVPGRRDPYDGLLDFERAPTGTAGT